MTKGQTLNRRATITDVAKAAGVSIKTVSRVVHREANIRPETERRVRAAMKAMNFRPRPSARGSARGNSYLFGLFFDNPNGNYLQELQRGALRAAREEGYHLSIEPCDVKSPSLVTEIINTVQQSNLAGVILSPPISDKVELIEALSARNIPTACLSSTVAASGINVSIDDVDAARSITARLIELGHERIGFIKGRQGTATTKRRYEGFRAALAENGLSSDRSLVRQGDWTFRSGVLNGEKLLSLKEPPTAIFAGNDDMAAGVVAAAYRLGLDIPDNLSVAGFDDSPIASSMWPALTTVRQPVAEMAAVAVRHLASLKRESGTDDPLPRQLLEFEIIERDSVAPLG